MSSGIRSSSISRADEVEVGLRGRREADLDLLDAELHEQVEHPLLARGVHRLDEGLVAVAQVGRAPDRRAVDHAVGPRAVGQVDGGVGLVLPVGHGHGGSAPPVGGLLPVCAGARDGYVVRAPPLAGKEEDQAPAGGSHAVCRFSVTLRRSSLRKA